MPSWEDQPHHRAQQVVGDIVQRQNHGADNISSTQLICKHPKCRNKIKRYSILSQLEQHIWFHSKRRQRECTCHNGGPPSRQEFESHLQQGKCEKRDPKRTPPDIKGMRVYGCIKDGTEFAFDSADALRKHLKNSPTRCPRCKFLFFKIAKHLRLKTCLQRRLDTNCPYCQKALKTLDDYRAHLASCPGNPDNQSPDSGPVLGGEGDHEDNDRVSSGGFISESQALSQVESEAQAHHQPGESSSVRSSPTASSSFPNAIQQQPISLNTDQRGDRESSEDDRDFGPEGGDEYANYGDDNTSLGGDEYGQSALHREAGHGRHRDQDHAESADMPLGAHPSPAVSSFRGFHWDQDHMEPVNQMQPGVKVQPQNQPQPVTENKLSFSFILSSESSQARFPRQSPPPAPGGSITFREAHSQPSHREAVHGMHWDRDRVEPTNQILLEAGSRGHSPPAAISIRGVLTPAATLEMEVRDGSTIYVSNGAPEHTVNLDANPAEDGGNDGYNSPASTLQLEGDIAQGGAVPASDVRDADPPKDYEDSNLREDLVSSEAAVAASSTNDDEDNDDGSESSSEDGYGSLPMVGKHAVRSAHRQPGILRKGRRRRRRRQKGRCEEAVRPNSPAHISCKRDQPGSEEGGDERTAKRQKTGHNQKASESVATEMGQGQGQSQGRPICLDSPAITTPPAEPSSVHSPPSRSLNASLDADSAKDGDGGRVSSGAFISSETAMVAPGPRSSGVGAHDDGDDVCGAPQQPDSPSQREEQRRQQQQDTLERQDIATEVTAKVDGAFGKMDERVKAAEVRQREAEKEEKIIEERIKRQKAEQQKLAELMKKSEEEVRKLQEELEDCQKEKQAAAREAINESQRKRKMAQEMEDVLRRNGGM
ncbi:hypothetical protein NW759_015914 [Fusarium solani]|nr:hypothetical protein NW759_015914 [Fusarium solani]